jgi:hypothetical protein
MQAPQDQASVAEGRGERRQMIDSFDIKFTAFWVIWIIGVGIFGWLISQPRKKKEDK